MIELDQKYVDVIVKRWQNLTGKDEILFETGESFNEIFKRENDGKSEQ
jgi:hypothetical protein